MGDRTKIEWTEPPGTTRGATWNMIGGCTRVSEACRRCWAERNTARLAATPTAPRYKGLAEFRPDGEARWSGEVRLFEDLLDLPLRWRAPRGIFVCSKSDLFHDQVPDSFIDLVWSAMLLAPQHRYFVLTKRPARMLRYLTAPYLTAPDLYQRVLRAADHHRRLRPQLTSIGISDPATFPAPWIWLGVTAEDQSTAEERVPLLLRCPAAVRWVSHEPALGPVDWMRWLGHDEHCYVDCRSCPRAHIDWLVVGGESGPGARPMHPTWARTARDHCAAAGVPFFFKQWGEWLPVAAPRAHDLRLMSTSGKIKPATYAEALGAQGDWWAVERVGKKAAGRLLDGREHSEYPASGCSAAATRPGGHMPRIRFHSTDERYLDCILTEQEIRDRSQQAHELLHQARKKKTDQEKLKAQATVADKEHRQLMAKVESFAEAARTGKESRQVLVHFEYDPGDKQVHEIRGDTLEELLVRKPYAREWDKQNELPFDPQPQPQQPAKIPWQKLRVWAGTAELLGAPRLSALTFLHRQEDLPGNILLVPLDKINNQRCTRDTPTSKAGDTVSCHSAALIDGAIVEILFEDEVDWEGFAAPKIPWRKLRVHRTGTSEELLGAERERCLAAYREGADIDVRFVPADRVTNNYCADDVLTLPADTAALIDDEIVLFTNDVDWMGFVAPPPPTKEELLEAAIALGKLHQKHGWRVDGAHLLRELFIIDVQVIFAAGLDAKALVKAYKEGLGKPAAKAKAKAKAKADDSEATDDSEPAAS